MKLTVMMEQMSNNTTQMEMKSTGSCMDGSQVWISQVNDGTDDCPDGEDEAHDDHGDHGDHHGPTFICGDGTEIPFDYVNDGEADCDDGADEQQYDTDGNEINWFDCMDGSQVWISQVNDGTDDCPDGEDEAHDDHGDHSGPSHYDNNEAGDGLSSYIAGTMIGM